MFRDYKFCGDVKCVCATCDCDPIRINIYDWTPYSELQDAADDEARLQDWGDAETCPQCHESDSREAAAIRRAESAEFMQERYDPAMASAEHKTQTPPKNE